MLPRRPKPRRIAANTTRNRAISLPSADEFAQDRRPIIVVCPGFMLVRPAAANIRVAPANA
jgi:hypothetical protein